MKKNIKYRIDFHTDWHCGSGLAAGADVDALVVKDKNNMPFVPGKTIKGLVREAVEEIGLLQGNDINAIGSVFVDAFGYFEKDKDEMKKGDVFFTNAKLADTEYQTIVSNDAARFMCRDLANTAIDKEGIAKEHSLRKMEVVVPCTLYGEILNVSEEMAHEIETAMKYIKRMGQNRNRGFGRCTMSIESIEEGGQQ